MRSSTLAQRLARLVPSGAVLALLLLALSAGAVAGQNSTHLSLANVSPRHVTTAEVVSFSVVYTDKTGAAPNGVQVVIEGLAPAPMAPSAGTLQAGLTYTYAAKLPAGHHAVDFNALDPGGQVERVGAGTVWVDEPSSGGGDTTGGSIPGGPGPVPSPTPVANVPGPIATSVPTQQPAPVAPVVPPVPGPTSSVSVNAVQPGATPIAPDNAAVARGDSGQVGPDQGAGSAGVTTSIVNDAAPSDGPGAPAENDVAVVQPLPPTVGGQTEQIVSPAGHDGVSAVSDDFGRRSLPFSQIVTELAPTIATGTAGVTAWAAFVLFGKRRRDGDPPAADEVLATAAATGLEPATAPAVEGIDESLLPRWRRPSLQAARKTDPLRMVVEAQHLTFEASPVMAVDGNERRLVRYRLVRLLDSPDELYSTEIGLLDQGDEVQLVERHGAYWRVLCPDGRQGWLHRMTLADPVALPVERNQPAIVVNDTADCSGDDLLDAYLRARHRDGAVD